LETVNPKCKEIRKPMKKTDEKTEKFEEKEEDVQEEDVQEKPDEKLEENVDDNLNVGLDKLEEEKEDKVDSKKERDKIKALEKQVTDLSEEYEKVRKQLEAKNESLTKQLASDETTINVQTQKIVSLIQEVIKLQNKLQSLKSTRSQQTNQENKKGTATRSSARPRTRKVDVHRMAFELLQTKKENILLKKKMEQFQRETQEERASKDAIISELMDETNAVLKISKYKRQSLLESVEQVDQANEFDDEMSAIKKEYFYALALSIKMGLAMGGITPNLLLDDLYALCESLDWRTWKVAIYHKFFQKLEQDKYSTLTPPNRDPLTIANNPAIAPDPIASDFSRSFSLVPTTEDATSSSNTTSDISTINNTSLLKNDEKKESTNLPLVVVE